MTNIIRLRDIPIQDKTRNVSNYVFLVGTGGKIANADTWSGFETCNSLRMLVVQKPPQGFVSFHRRGQDWQTARTQSFSASGE